MDLISRVRPFLFVGIDFGTYASGYSYVLRNSTEPQLQSSFPEQSTPYPKCLTALLYDEYNNVVAWGWQARSQYLALGSDQRAKHKLVRHFKLGLAPGGEVELPAGLNIDMVVVDYLKLLHQHCVDVLTTSFPSSFRPSLVRYAVTVPANWDEQAKQTMRRAVALAGIVPHQSSENLLLLHEPEAAAVTVRVRDRVDMRPGQVFLVVDAGGGTTDITVHKVVQKSSGVALDEATYRDGMLCGGITVDSAFEHWLSDRLGRVYQLWKDDPLYAVPWAKLIDDDWEHIKRNFSSNGVDRTTELSVPRSLYRLLPEDVKQQLADESGDDDAILVSGADLAGFFNNVVDQIIDHINDVLERCPEQPDSMMLVGGLASNKYVIERIQSAFSHVRDIVVPPYGYSAILQGAALFAANPAIISGRRSALSYGLRHSSRALDDCPQVGRFMHKEKHVMYFDSFFTQYIEQNQLIDVDYEVEHIFYPIYKHQDAVAFDIYGTTERVARYTTEPGMQLVGSVTVSIQDPMRVDVPNAYRLRAAMKFGTTEVQVKVVDEQTGEESATAVIFSSLISSH